MSSVTMSVSDVAMPISILGMLLSEWPTIIAIASSPFFAVWATSRLNIKKESDQRKRDIFISLMCTRDHMTSWEHVKAINLIEFEFKNSNFKEKEVLDVLKEYIDLLYDDPPTDDSDYESKKLKWDADRADLFIDLLHKMAITLSYDFDQKHIQRSYGLAAHANIENEQSTIRKGIIEILKGRQSLPIRCTNLPTENNGDRNGNLT